MYILVTSIGKHINNDDDDDGSGLLPINEDFLKN